MKERLTLAELAEASGLPARTLRFYITRGLLDGPVKAGRNAEYTREHLERLERIRGLQSEGRTLAEIGRALGGVAAEQAAAPPTAWWQHAIADDIVLWTRVDMSPWRAKQVGAALAGFAHSVQQIGNGKGRNER